MFNISEIPTQIMRFNPRKRILEPLMQTARGIAEVPLGFAQGLSGIGKDISRRIDFQGGQERFGAFERGIKQRSFAPLKQSFRRQVKKLNTPLAISKYGIPTEWTKNLTDEVKNTFPFEKEALSSLEEMGNVRQTDFFGRTKGRYLQSGQEIFNLIRVFGFSRKIAGKIADMKFSQKFDKANIQIEKDLKQPIQKILVHEMLHHIYNKKNFHFKNQKFAEDWYNSWNMLVGKDPEKYAILFEIDDRMTRSGYDMNNPVSIADERYSFLGQEAMEKGIDVIPEELREFYLGVIKMPIQNQ